MAQKSLGLIQSRGLGDILIALPIARHYHQAGYRIHWPICEEFWGSVRDSVAWVDWIPIPADARGEFFYAEPLRRLTHVACDEILCLYQSLNILPELSKVPWYQIQHFDEFKYSKARVPFLQKWTLAECVTRNPVREAALVKKLVTTPDYCVTHLASDAFACNPDLSFLPAEWQRIPVTPKATDCLFDWLSVLEGARAVVCIDSSIANLVDQFKIERPTLKKYWIPRSHIHLTPVLGTAWTILAPPPGSLAARPIFGAVPR